MLSLLTIKRNPQHKRSQRSCQGPFHSYQDKQETKHHTIYSVFVASSSVLTRTICNSYSSLVITPSTTRFHTNMINTKASLIILFKFNN